MKLAIVVLCLLGSAVANPVLYKVSMEIMEQASNSTSSESSEQSDTSEKDSSQENTSENNTSESLESMSDDRTSDMSHSHSLEDRFGTGETGMTTDNSQGSLENIRKSWVHLVTVKLVSKEDADQTDEDDSNTKSSESTENQENQTHSSSSSSSGENSRPVVDSNETSESRSSNSSSTESQESSQSTESPESTESHSDECPPGADSDECDSEEYQFRDIGDNGASDPFNGFHTPDNNEHGVVFKR